MAVKVIYTNDYGASVEFSKNSGIRITDIDGLSANEIDLSETTVTNQVGSSITGASIKSKDLTIEGRYAYKPEIRKRLLAVILPGVAGKLRYINDKEGVDVYWDAQPSKTPEISLNPVWQTFQFTLKLPYPYPRSSEPQIIRFSGMTSNFKFKQSYSSTVEWTISDKDISHLKVITNKGALSTGFVITFEALTDDIVAPTVVNVDTRDYMTFTELTLAKGDILTVNTNEGQRGAYLTHNGEKSNVFSLMDYGSTFFLLDTGDNTLRSGASSNEDNLAVTLTFDEIVAGV